MVDYAKLYHADYVTQVPVSASILDDAEKMDDGTFCLDVALFSYIDADGVERDIKANEMYMIANFEKCHDCGEWCTDRTRTERGDYVCERCLGRTTNSSICRYYTNRND